MAATATIQSEEEGSGGTGNVIGCPLGSYILVLFQVLSYLEVQHTWTSLTDVPSLPFNISSRHSPCMSCHDAQGLHHLASVQV